MNQHIHSHRPTILDIPFDALTMGEVLEKIETHLKTGQQPLFIATPNPEMLLEARKNSEFRKTLQHTNLNIADGVGIILAARWLKQPKLPGRVTGTDLTEKICEKFSHSRIFLLGAAPGIAEKTAKKLHQKYSTHIVGTDDGSAKTENDENLRHKINAAKPDILFVAFGAPKQELWLARNLPHLKTIKIAIGVGGAFDFISGKTRRAPAIMRKLGLEWLFRLIIQPSRIARIFNATIRFPLAIIKNSFTAPPHPPTP